MAETRRLGRGLDAILGQTQEEASKVEGIREVELTALVPNRYQPRANFEEAGIDELARSIRAQGIIQPLIVTPGDEGTFTIVAGERRWRAAQKAGIRTVPVLVRELADRGKILEVALVENLQRTDLNAIEEAEAFRTLMDAFDLTQEQIASRVGRARPTIANSLRLLRLPQQVQDLLRRGSLTPGQARPLLGLEGSQEQIELAERAVRDGLTARRLESLVHEGRIRRRADPHGDTLDPDTAAAAESLTRNLQTRVEIRRRGRGGALLIHFHSEEELMRLYDLLVQQRKDA